MQPELKVYNKSFTLSGHGQRTWHAPAHKIRGCKEMEKADVYQLAKAGLTRYRMGGGRSGAAVESVRSAGGAGVSLGSGAGSALLLFSAFWLSLAQSAESKYLEQAKGYSAR